MIKFYELIWDLSQIRVIVILILTNMHNVAGLIYHIKQFKVVTTTYI
jgi:hypothetical protein